MFGSRKVFVTYIICWSTIIATALGSMIISLATRANSPEKVIEHIALCVVAILLLHIPIGMYSRLNFHFPPLIHITIAFFIVAHFVLGEVYRFYDYFSLFDKALHITAGIVIAVCGLSIVHAFSKTDSGEARLSPFFLALFSFCFAITLLTLWEIFEYGVDTFFNMNMQRWQDGLIELGADAKKGLPANVTRGTGLIDTMTDLIVGTIGAAIICAIGGYGFRKNHNYAKFLIVRRKPEE
jgi:hypothetical protein